MASENLQFPNLFTELMVKDLKYLVLCCCVEEVVDENSIFRAKAAKYSCLCQGNGARRGLKRESVELKTTTFEKRI